MQLPQRLRGSPTPTRPTDNPAAPTITAADLDWGMLIANTSVQTLMTAVKERVADNEYEARLKRLHKIIADAGSAGIDGSALTRASQWVNRRERVDILAQLADAGMIRVQEFTSGAKGGAPKRVYFDIG